MRARLWIWLAWTVAAFPLLAGCVFRTDWSWGWDHLSRTPTWWRALVCLLFVLAWISPTARGIGSASDRLGASLERSPRAWALGLFAVGALLFAAFPLATQVYGDSLVILRYGASDRILDYLRTELARGVQLRGSLVNALHVLISLGTGLSLLHSYRLVEAIAGGLFLFVNTRLAARLPGPTPGVRALIVWLVLVDGANQLFFGHVETYALPRLFAAVFLVRLLLSLHDPEHHPPRPRDFVWLGIAILLHVQMAVFLPTAVFWWLDSRAPRRLRPRLVLGSMAAGTFLFLLLYLACGAIRQDYLYSGGNPTLAQMFLPVSTGDLPFRNYALFSRPHLLDMGGSLWALSSGAAIFCLLLLLPGLRGDRGLMILAPSLYLALCHDFFLNPSIGYPFDWDLMCVISLPLLYIAIHALVRAGERVRPYAAALLPLGLATATLFGVNAAPGAARHRAQDLAVWLHRSYYGGTHYRLSASFAEAHDPAQELADREGTFRALCRTARPGDRQTALEGNNLGIALHAAGRDSEALATYRVVAELDTSEVMYKKALGHLETVAGDRARGLELLRDYLRRRPQDADAWSALAEAEAAAGEIGAAREARARASRLSMESPRMDGNGRRGE